MEESGSLVERLKEVDGNDISAKLLHQHGRIHTDQIPRLEINDRTITSICKKFFQKRPFSGRTSRIFLRYETERIF